MDVIKELIDHVFPSLQSEQKLVWLKRDFKKTKEFWMEVKYIINYLDMDDHAKVISDTHKWQNDKTNTVLKEIEEGKTAEDFEPIRLTLHPNMHVFRVGDGISKLKAFRKKRIPMIKVILQIGRW